MTGFEIQRHGDGSLEFQGTIDGDDLRDVIRSLGKKDLARLCAHVGDESPTWRADQLRVLELIFRRIDGQVRGYHQSTPAELLIAYANLEHND